jgi:hypothetical protein
MSREPVAKACSGRGLMLIDDGSLMAYQMSSSGFSLGFLWYGKYTTGIAIVIHTA